VALAPLLADRNALSGRLRDVAAANDRLAGRSRVPADVRRVIERLVRDVADLPGAEVAQTDPYLLLALQRGLLAASAALSRGPREQRAGLRIALEQIRQALRDVSDAHPVADDRSAKEVARWLAATLSVPQAVLADLLGTTPRTFQRWISPADPTRPQGEEEWRLRIIAQLAAQLRHALTGPGVVAWLQRPRPELKGRPPISLLEDPDATRRLLTLASRARTSAAA
jgi:hypothetical protein